MSFIVVDGFSPAAFNYKMKSLNTFTERPRHLIGTLLVVCLAAGCSDSEESNADLVQSVTDAASVNTDSNTDALPESVSTTDETSTDTLVEPVDESSSASDNSANDTATDVIDNSSNDIEVATTNDPIDIVAVENPDISEMESSSIAPEVEVSTPISGDIASNSVCMGLLHPNGVTYCFEESTREFSATQADGSVLWSFVLPGNNSENFITAIIPINDNVAVIANNAPDTPENPLYVEDNRFEISFFEPGGRFIATRRLLLVPSNGRYVAICENSDLCTRSLGTHEFERDSVSDEWRLVRFVINSSPVSTAIINAENMGEFVDILDEISIGQPLLQPLAERANEVTDSLDGLVELSDSDQNSITRVYMCPFDGTVSRIGDDQSTQNIFTYEQCEFPEFSIDGIFETISTSGATTTYDQLLVTEGSVTEFADAVHIGPSGGGLFSTETYDIQQFQRTTPERMLSVLELEYSQISGTSPLVGNGFDGWRGVTPDGRTGVIRSISALENRLELSYEFEDTRIADDMGTIDVTVNLEDISENIQFELDEGGILPEQDITLMISAPGDTSQDNAFFEFRDGCGSVCGRGWSAGSITVLANDGSRLEINPAGEGSALGRLNVFTGAGPLPAPSVLLPAQSVLIDLTLLY